MDRLSRQLSLCLSVCARVSCFSLCIFCLLGSRVWVWGAMHAFMMLAAESLIDERGMDACDVHMGVVLWLAD